MTVFITAPRLAALGVRHAYFTRQGGVSSGDYESLNGGVGSDDARENVEENRRRMAETLGVTPAKLLVPFQVHSADCLAVDAPWTERPRCDGLATATPGLALGVTGADCGMLLFADPKARVIGAAHAGWKGAFDDILGATVARMETLGAARENIHVALGPTIGPKSYEVGPEFVARFLAASRDHARFFTPSTREQHAMFDLPGFLTMRAEQARVADFENLALDTYADPVRFFSYRRKTHEGAKDYGRLVSAIALA
jgi:YfiH family protein